MPPLPGAQDGLIDRLRHAQYLRDLRLSGTASIVAEAMVVVLLNFLE